MALLEIEDLHVEFPSQGGVLRAVEGVSLSLDEGEVLGIVGESGSGKSVTMLALMGLLAAPGRVRAKRRCGCTCGWIAARRGGARSSSSSRSASRPPRAAFRTSRTRCRAA